MERIVVSSLSVNNPVDSGLTSRQVSAQFAAAVSIKQVQHHMYLIE